MKLLFYVSKLYSLPVIQPIAAEALRQNIDIALFVSSKVKRGLPPSLTELELFTELQDAISFAPDFVLCPGNFVDFRLPGIKVELFHGIGIEKLSHYRIRHFFDIYLTSGPVVTERFREIQRKYRYFSVIETGWPKMDHILAYNTAELKKRYKVPHDKKVILYAPTHSSRMESAKELLPLIETIMKQDEIWFCKPHEFMERDVLVELRSKKIILIDSYDITPYLHLADVLVSDTSSVVYEFMALNKPVITLKTIARKDKGINIQSPLELRTALDRSFANPSEFSSRRERHMSEVNPRLDGTVSKTIIDQLLMINPDLPLGTKRKPINFFRKLQILYHSRFRKGYLR